MSIRGICRTTILLFLIAFLRVLVSTPAASAGEINLTWDPPITKTDGTALTDLAGYKIFYGTAAGFYNNILDVGNVTSYTVTGLTEGKTYYFATTAYDTSSNESRFSNEIYRAIPCTDNPSSVIFSITATLTGMNLSGDTTITTSCKGQPPPSGYNPGNVPRYYDMATTNTYNESVEVCIYYDENNYSDENLLNLFQLTDSTWKNITNPGYPDVVNNTICGTTTSLSSFIIAEEGSTAFLQSISTRGQVLTGDGVLIGGFIIDGINPRTVLIRARGPSLANFGIQNTLSNPSIQLYSGSTVIAQNNDWQTTNPLCGTPAIACGNNSDIMHTGLDPCSVTSTGCFLDSAIHVTLPPGGYTVIMRGVNNGTGIGILEVFDVDTGVSSKLISISTRGTVLTGDGIMIGGFIVSGGDKTLLLRARGPSLANFGISGAIANPMLDLYSGQTVIATNNDWQTTLPQCNAPLISCGTEADIRNTGLDPCSVTSTGCTLDSAMYVTLPPGAYTAVLRGVNNATGVGIVEIFEVGQR